MNFGLLAMGIAGVGAVGAAVADTYYPDKALTVPDGIPGIGGKTVEPGTLLGILGLGLGVATGVPAFVAFGAGAALYEGGKFGAEYALPGPPELPPGGGAAVGQMSLPPGFDASAYDSISDREILNSLNSMDELGGGRY